MADTITIDLEWENNVNFFMTFQKDGGTKVTIIRCDENAHLAKAWKDIEAICKKFFEAKLDEIGVAMKAP